MYTQNYQRVSSTNSLATTSLISGIVSWILFIIVVCFSWGILPLLTVATMGVGALFYCCILPFQCLPPLGWIVGVITGHIARNQIKQSTQSGDGMAIAGLIMGYLGLALIAISICLSITLSILGISVPFIDEFLRQMPSTLQ